MPAGPCGYLLDILMEAGPFEHHPMGGFLVLGWQTLAAYNQLTHEITDADEARAVISLSRAYLQGFEAGQNPASKPPTEWE